MYNEVIKYKWEQLYTKSMLIKFGLQTEDFTVKGNHISCRFGLDMTFDPKADRQMIITNQKHTLYWLDDKSKASSFLINLYLALCFREKYLKFENPEEFNKHKVVDGNKTNIFALSLLDPVTNVQELVNCFREITAFFRSDLKLDFNPLLYISFDGIRSTNITIGGQKMWITRPWPSLVDYDETKDEYNFYSIAERSFEKSTELTTNSIDMVYFALRVFRYDYFGVRNALYFDKISD